MSWMLILEKVISWGVPVICTALVAIFVKPHMKAQKKGQEILDQEEWDSRSVKLVERMDSIEQNHAQDKKEIIEKIESLKEGDKAIEEILSNILQKLDTNNQQNHERFDAMDQKNTDAFIQIYQRDLIVDGKTYLNAKFWTPHQKANFFQRYRQYKTWGGNGDIEPWIEKLNKLPIHYPDVENFNE